MIQRCKKISSGSVPLLKWNTSSSTARKVSVFGVFLVRIFPYSDWKRKDTQSECGKIRTRKALNTISFHAVFNFSVTNSTLNVFLLIFQSLLNSYFVEYNKRNASDKFFHAIGLFQYPLKTSEIKGFLIFSGDIGRYQWYEMC